MPESGKRLKSFRAGSAIGRGTAFPGRSWASHRPVVTVRGRGGRRNGETPSRTVSGNNGGRGGTAGGAGMTVVTSRAGVRRIFSAGAGGAFFQQWKTTWSD